MPIQNLTDKPNMLIFHIHTKLLDIVLKNIKIAKVKNGKGSRMTLTNVIKPIYIHFTLYTVIFRLISALEYKPH